MIFNYDVSELSNAVANIGTNNVKNNSSAVAGTTLTTAINNLASAISGNTTNITNLSNTVSNLGSSDIKNQSSVVAGTSVTTAINNLSSGIAANTTAIANLDGSDIANDSQKVSGSKVTDALDSLYDYTHNVSTAKNATNNTTNISSGTVTSILSGNIVQISGQIKAVSTGVGAWLQTLCTLNSEAKANTARTVWAYANYNNNWEFVALELLADGTLRTRISSGSGNQIVGNSWITIPNQIVFV